jgi:archaellum component FlaC
MSMAFTAAAACVAILMTVFVEPDISKELERQYTRLAEMENEILTIVETEYPEETEMIMNTVRTITADAIPLEEQLPDEMSAKEKSRILNEYYDLKYSALENLMANIDR